VDDPTGGLADGVAGGLADGVAGGLAGSVAGEKRAFGETPALSFRAAAVANLAIRPLAGGEAGFSFEWKIGPPEWLPGYKI